MNYYKKLVCDRYTEINKEILEYVCSIVDVDNPKDFWNPISTVAFVKNTPLFQAWVKTLQVQIKSLAVTVGTHQDCCGPHIDTPPALYKLSWPILNTETTWNRWFKESSDACDIIVNHWGGRCYSNLTQLKEIHRARVDSPMLIYAGVPHDVWFEENSKFPRLGLQCQLMKEPMSL